MRKILVWVMLLVAVGVGRCAGQVHTVPEDWGIAQAREVWLASTTETTVRRLTPFLLDNLIYVVDNGTTGTVPNLGDLAIANTILYNTTDTADLTLRDPYGNVAVEADRLVPVGTVTLGASGSRWATLYGTVGDFSTQVNTNVIRPYSSGGNLDLLDDDSDAGSGGLRINEGGTVTVPGRFSGDLLPGTDSARDLGSTTLRWAEIWGDLLTVDNLSLDANTLAATDSNGISLKDDGGNLGVFVEDGGFVGVGPSATNPENQFEVINTNNADSTALVQFRQLGTFDASVRLRVPATSWTFGIDNSDSDIFKIENSTVLGGASPAFALDTSGNLTALGSATFGGGYGSTGATISSAGALSIDGALIVQPTGGSGFLMLGNSGGVEYLQVGADASDTGAQLVISRMLSASDLQSVTFKTASLSTNGNTTLGDAVSDTVTIAGAIYGSRHSYHFYDATVTVTSAGTSAAQWVGDGVDEDYSIIMPHAGSVVGLSVMGNITETNTDSEYVGVFIDGATTQADDTAIPEYWVEIDAGSTGIKSAYGTQARGTDTFTAGQKLTPCLGGTDMTVANNYTMTNVHVVLEVVFND